MKPGKKRLLQLIEGCVVLCVVSEVAWLIVSLRSGHLDFPVKLLHAWVTVSLILSVAFLIRTNHGVVADTSKEGEWLKTKFQAIAEGIVVQDRNGIIDSNPAAQRILSLNADQLKGRQSIDPRWKAIREDGSKFNGEEHPASITLRTGESIRNFIMGIETPEGERRWLSVSTEPIRDVDGAFDSIVVSFADVTQQRDQAKRLELIIDGSGLGTWEWDITSGEVIYGEYWARMLGYQTSEIEPNVSAWERLLNPTDLYRVVQAIQEHFQGQSEEYRCELQMRHKDGTWKWILATGKITERTLDGAPRRMVGVHVDIHAIKTLQAELEVARQKSQAASDAKSEFLANMSHEIRTPMTAILGFTELLASEAELDNSIAKGHIDTIQRNGAQLLSIINDILDLSKVEAGKMTLECVPCDPITLVKDVMTLMQVRASEKGIRLHFESNTNTPFAIKTDPVRLRQILVNLIGNAIKFTEKGSVVVKTILPPTCDSLSFQIIDTGIGLKESQKERLFDAFIQADASMTRRFGGTGLGLNISSRLAKMLGGSITVQSVFGNGSTFELCLHAIEYCDASIIASLKSQSNEAATNVFNPSEAMNPSIDSQLKGFRILFAEDGPDNQRLISHFLRKSGAEVKVVENGKQVVEALTIDGTLDGDLITPPPFDMVLSDMHMPEMDGYAAARKLRDKGWLLPIIAITAHAMKSNEQDCLAAGCDDCVTKPISRAGLLEACSKWLPTQVVNSVLK